ncbi:sporulation phosphorelay system protein KapB [Cohnella cellulosilytica]|uniref:Sporulation phosphorelay system protein KapB n=1 Tax=Cohnella cellulosilytica TaxID=986710 RepID=A0ABW2FMP3_9BACL
MNETEAGKEIVKISYKTGDYLGETIDRDDRRALVRVLAVLRHPTQGDLHSSYDPDVAIFHERRALAHTEKVWVPIQTAKPYAGEIPDYRESLRAALAAEQERTDRLKRWAERCLDNLETLRKDYGL